MKRNVTLYEKTNTYKWLINNLPNNNTILNNKFYFNILDT